MLLNFLAAFSIAKVSPSPGETCRVIGTSQFSSRLTFSRILENEVCILPATLNGQTSAWLAEALHAECEDQKGSWRIERKRQTIVDLALADQKALNREIQSTIRRVDQSVERFARYEEAAPYQAIKQFRADHEANREALDTSALQAQEITPAGQFLCRSLATISKNHLSLVPPGKVTVFSNRPLGRELPFDRDDSSEAEYLSKQERFSEWAEKSGSALLTPQQRWLLPASPFKVGPRTFQLFIDRRNAVPIFSLTVYDQAGRREADASFSSREWTSAVEQGKTKPLGKVKISDELAQKLDRADPQSIHFSIDALDPLQNEPLDGVVREAMAQYAASLGFRDVIACIPDQLLDATLSVLDRGEIDLDRFQRALDEAGIEKIAHAQTLVVRPRNPSLSEALRLDRKPISRLFGVVKDKKIDLNSLAAYHSAYVEQYGRNALLKRIETPIRDVFHLSEESNWFAPHPVLALFGALTEGQRKALEQTGTLAISSKPFDPFLQSLAEYLSRQIRGEQNSLAVSWPRLADPSSRPLALSTLQIQTLIKRKALRESVIITAKGTTGQYEKRQGKGLVVDPFFIPLTVLLDELPRKMTEEDYRKVSERFLCQWARDRVIGFSFTLNNRPPSTPILLRERIDQSNEFVPIDKVPGLEFKRE